MRKLLQDRRGLTVVEFAMVAPVMLTLICGTIEIGHITLARSTLDGAVLDAARKATASLETGEAERTTIMRNSITEAMGSYPPATGQSLTITTTVFRDFSTAYPEPFDDQNGDGVHQAGENYVDRNRNGRWDPATPVAGTLGGPGDVVAYQVTYPKSVLFGFLGPVTPGGAWVIGSTTVVRNEAIARKVTP